VDAPAPKPAEPPVLELWRPYDPIEFRVRCERRLHRIRIDGQGRLVLVDHDMELELLAAALGSDEMRCPAVIDRFKEAIRTGLVGRLPDKARPHIHAVHKRKERRRSWKAERQALIWAGPVLASAAGSGPLGEIAAHTWEAQRSKEAYMNRYVRRLLARSKLATAHPKGADPFLTPHAIQVTVAAAQQIPYGIHLDVHGRQGFAERTALRGTIFVAEHWWRRVHLAGMDLIDGRLVVDAPALADDNGVVYSFAGMTPRARRRAKRAPAPDGPAQLPLPDIMGATRTATVCVLADPNPAAYPSDRWRMNLDHRWFKAVAEAGAPWRLTEPVEAWRVPRS